MLKLLKIAAIGGAAIGLLLYVYSLPANAAARAVIGEGLFVITTPDGHQFGVTPAGRIDTRVNPFVEVPVAKQDDTSNVDNPTTFRLQFENITGNEHDLPDCPRGVIVTRYGKRGC